MIAYVKGTVEDISEDNAVVDIGGIGVNVRISADTAARLPGIGEKVKLYTYTSVREDAMQLFGFLARNDLEIFKKCITVSGIGPKGALAILSVLDADSLRFAIMSGDVKAITKAPGIGTRTEGQDQNRRCPDRPGDCRHPGRRCRRGHPSEEGGRGSPDVPWLWTGGGREGRRGHRRHRVHGFRRGAESGFEEDVLM